jgi:ribonuclease R
MDIMNKKFRRESRPQQEITWIEGIARRNPKGFGWLETNNTRREGIFIPPREMMLLMDGDKVRCRLEPNPKGPVAYIEQITEHAKAVVIGTFHRKKRDEIVETQGQILASPVLIPSQFRNDTRLIESGTLVEVEITKYPGKGPQAEGRVVRILGKKGDFVSEVEVLLSQSKVLRTFTPAAQMQARTFGENPSTKDIQERRDLRNLPLCTIDGETAKDFDDAVYACYEGDSIWVTVAIADVSHYVTPGSPIDAEAFARGTSIYYPGHCIPMIPEELSNGLCSLKPNVPRLCMVVEMLITKSGTIKKVRFDEAVIHSHARLTYTKVQAYVDGGFKAMHDIPEKVGESLQVLWSASRALRSARKKRGALDFDGIESVVALDDSGEPIAINPVLRLEAHRMVEDLMVAANETVAQYLEKKGWPTIFRIHEVPQNEKLKMFLMLAQGMGVISPVDVKELQKEKVEPKSLAKLIDRFQGHSAKGALDILMLRSMMQARYSAENVGHFGLASKSYLHFTSPIRRYPDLSAHRVLRLSMFRKKKLTESEITFMMEEMAKISAHCSEKERKAVELERQIDSLHAAWMMQDKVGEEDMGIVTNCADFGLFVRLAKFNVEGLLHVAHLSKKRMLFDADQMRLVEKKSGRSYKIGDKLKVRVLSVNVAKRFIDLGPVLGEKQPKEKDRGKKTKGQLHRRHKK